MRYLPTGGQWLLFMLLLALWGVSSCTRPISSLAK